MLQHITFILFFFALGACIGSFLNVVVWRLPRGQSLVTPPSSCPKCGHRLAWRDNLPIIGWLKLGGRCRYCREPISPRYPIVEALTAVIFAFYYVAFFNLQQGPCAPSPAMISDELRFLHPRLLNIRDDWPMFGLYMYLLASLLAASLIDIESYSIPAVIFWWAAGVGLVVHAIIDNPQVPGTLEVGALGASMAVGGGIGLIISLVLLRLGLIPLSFAQGGPLLDVDKEKLRRQWEQEPHRQGKVMEYQPPPIPEDFTPAQIRAEMNKEIIFLLPPLTLALIFALAAKLEPSIYAFWNNARSADWLSGALGAVLGALVGGFLVWLTRILGSMVAGREAMGLGDVHLMFGVGAIIGAGGATLAFFIAPFFGLAIAIYRWLSGKGRELPYGPFLGLGTAAVMLFYCPMAAYLTPGLQGAAMLIRDVFVRH